MKYIKPYGAKQQLYIPRTVWAVLKNAKIPLVFTEGEKKALKATQEGHPTIALSGVYGWLSKGEPISDFDLIKFKGRIIYIIFDSDKKHNPMVMRAEQRFADFLKSKGAKVLISTLPEEGP